MLINCAVGYLCFTVLWNATHIYIAVSVCLLTVLCISLHYGFQHRLSICNHTLFICTVLYPYYIRAGAAQHSTLMKGWQIVPRKFQNTPSWERLLRNQLHTSRQADRTEEVADTTFHGNVFCCCCCLAVL